MAKSKLVVETPYGIATRTTERAYQFVIVSRGQSVEYQRARHEAGAQASLAIAAKYERWIAKAVNGVYHEVYNGGYGHADHTVEDLTRYAQDARERAARPFVLDKDPETQFIVQGWSGSMKGASKFYADAVRYGYIGALIVPVK